MSHSLTRYLLHALRLTPAFVFFLLVALPGHYALARSRTGCSLFGIDSQTCLTVEGDGLRVNSVMAYFKKRRTYLCNWRYEIAYADINGYNYNTVRSSTTSGCRDSGNFPITYTPYKSVAKGRVCARLYASGSYVDAACMDLSP